MIARENCVTTEELDELLSGRLPPERFAAAMEHVDSCHVCSSKAAGRPIAAWTVNQAAAESTGYTHEPECQAVIGQLLLQPNSATAGDRDGQPLPIDSLGPYRLRRWLGSGGMGAVYLAEHERLKRLAAIKLLPRDKLLQSGWLERFNREMTSIAALEHAHVVRAIDAGDEAGWHYLVMEYLDGADLSKVCRCFGQLPIGTACELVRQAALGLAAIHELGMTHRDIKPSNMFLTRQGTVKLLDLGLVLSGDSPLAADERLTTVGHLMGTLPYMAREQLLDASSVDWRADIYSLGATLFRMITGRAPFGPAKNIALTIQAITTTACPQIQTLQPDIPRPLADLIHRMLSHDRSTRPESAQQLAAELAAFSDAQAPQGLIRAALSQMERQAAADLDIQTFTGANASGDGRLTNRTNAAVGDGSTRRRWTWLAAAALPLAFMAGIVMTIATDVGTLVIESDEPGVTVKVSQGQSSVESLKVENQPGQLRLYSGKYLVELIGVQSDGLLLSQSQVSITRGQKEVVRVRRQEPATTPSTVASAALLATSDVPSSGNSFQGKSFAWWMDRLEHEKDIATLAQAIQAVALLAETEADKLAAAKKVLLPARQFGGLIISGRPQNSLPNELSGWFMAELMDGYANFLPTPGLVALVEELESGNELSRRACHMLLHIHACRLFGHSFGPNKDNLLSEHIVSLASSQAGRELLGRLEAQLKKNQSDANVLMGFKWWVVEWMTIATLLQHDFTSNQDAVDWARERLSLAEAGQSPNISFQYAPYGKTIPQSPLDATTACFISRLLPDAKNPVLILGLLEATSTLLPTSEADITEALKRMLQQYPEESLTAMKTHLQNAVETVEATKPPEGAVPAAVMRPSAYSNPSPGGMGGTGGMVTALRMALPPTRTISHERSQLAKDFLLAHAASLPGLRDMLTKIQETKARVCIFGPSELASLAQ